MSDSISNLWGLLGSGNTTLGGQYLPARPTAATMGGNFDPGSPTATDWNKIAGALGKLGGVAGGGNSGNDANYLRINAQAAPYSPGGTGVASLLQQLIQMHQAAALAQQPALQPIRASLLG